LTTAACGGLRSTPDCRPRRALLHLPYSCAPPCGPAILVTQDPSRTLGCEAFWAAKGDAILDIGDAKRGICTTNDCHHFIGFFHLSSKRIGCRGDTCAWRSIGLVNVTSASTPTTRRENHQARRAEGSQEIGSKPRRTTATPLSRRNHVHPERRFLGVLSRTVLPPHQMPTYTPKLLAHADRVLDTGQMQKSDSIQTASHPQYAKSKTHRDACGVEPCSLAEVCQCIAETHGRYFTCFSHHSIWESPL
jgi:hypothetical protein